MVSSANQSSRSISPSSSQAATIALDLVGDGGGVAPHELVPQRLVVEHLAAAFGRGVEDHPLAEHRGHERVGLGLVEDLLGGPEEELVGLGPGQQHHVPVGQAEHADVAALGTDPVRAGRWGRPGARRGGRSPSSPPDTLGGSRCSTAVVMALPRPSSSVSVRMGASGCSSMTVAWVPRGRDTTATMASATPGRAHEVGVAGESPGRPLLDDLAGHLGIPVHAHAGQGGTGTHDGGPHPGALELHLQGADVALESPLGGHVGGHGRPGSFGHVGGDEDDVAPAPARSSAGARARTSRWVPLTLTASTPSNASGPVSSTEPAMFWAALDTRISTGPRASTAALANCSIESPSARSRWMATASPPSLADGRGRRPRTRPPAGRRAPPGARARPGPRPWPARCPTTRRSPPPDAARGGARTGASAELHGGGQGGEAPDVDRVDPLDAVRVDVVVGDPLGQFVRGRSAPRAGPGARPCRSGDRCRS